MLDNLKIVGTTHLDNKEKIESIIKDFNPEIIGVELCNTRLNVLVINPVKQVEQSNEGILNKISNAVRKKAEEEKVVYGSDMINASKYALNNKIPLICVDRDIIEIQNLMNKIPSNELQEFLKEIVKFEQEGFNKEVNEQDTLNDLKTRFPVAFEFLITSRELYILNMILKNIIKYPNKRILIFLGKGHLESINKQLGLQ
jgi:pheromone shutdown protein TraB